MKKLNSIELESFQGGKSNRDCMFLGAGLALTLGLGLWGPAIAIAANSGDCMP